MICFDLQLSTDLKLAIVTQYRRTRCTFMDGNKIFILRVIYLFYSFCVLGRQRFMVVMRLRLSVSFYLCFLKYIGSDKCEQISFLYRILPWNYLNNVRISSVINYLTLSILGLINLISNGHARYLSSYLVSNYESAQYPSTVSFTKYILSVCERLLAEKQSDKPRTEWNNAYCERPLFCSSYTAISWS